MKCLKCCLIFATKLNPIVLKFIHKPLFFDYIKNTPYIPYGLYYIFEVFFIQPSLLLKCQHYREDWHVSGSTPIERYAFTMYNQSIVGTVKRIN